MHQRVGMQVQEGAWSGDVFLWVGDVLSWALLSMQAHVNCICYLYISIAGRAG